MLHTGSTLSNGRNKGINLHQFAIKAIKRTHRQEAFENIGIAIIAKLASQMKAFENNGMVIIEKLCILKKTW